MYKVVFKEFKGVKSNLITIIFFGALALSAHDLSFESAVELGVRIQKFEKPVTPKTNTPR